MAYIYEIINDINNKSYVGKTEFSLEKRFKEHCRDSQRPSFEKRPLYAAMRKYGIEHFSIHLLEETNNPTEREKYWIEILGTFKNGYNATKGGDGASYVDYDLVLALFKEGYGVSQISNIMHHDEKTIRMILKNSNISCHEIKQREYQQISKMVAQLDKETEEIIAVYSSTEEANRALKKQSSGHISQVCKGKRKTAYGYKWKYL